MSLQEDLDARGSNMADLRSTTQGLPIGSQCQQTSYTGNSTSDMFCIPRTFERQIFKIEDGTRWQVLQPLSQVKLQQTHSPCEGTQVFTCICVDGAWGSYGEMVVKIKFQVRATQESIEEYKGLIADYDDALRRSPSTEENESLLARTRRDLSRCTQPSRRLNYDTKQERKALDRLGAQQCANAPWLLGFAQGQLCPGIHAEAISEGYCAFLLMTKLPATSLPHIHFCKMPLEKRDRIRAAFKEALIAVWGCGVVPNDNALRNILWDQCEQRCYIVDYEECRIINTQKSTLPVFSDETYDLWELGEAKVLECQPCYFGQRDNR